MQRLREKIKNNDEVKIAYQKWLNNELTKEVLNELKEEGEPTLLPFNVVNKEMSTYMLGVYAGWFGAIRMIENMAEESLMKEIESKYMEEI